MALATLSIDIVAKLASLEAGLDQANRVLQKNAAAMEARFGKIGSIATGAASGIVSAFAGVSFVQLLRSTNAGVDALNDVKDATGASIESLSALEDVGARTGTGFDTVTASLVKFNKTLGDAKAGSAEANIFKALNLDIEQLKLLDPAEALRQTAVALSGYADSGNKARIIQELFGRSAREVAPFLNDLATKTKLVGTVTAEQAAAAEKFAQNLAALEKNALDLARSISAPLVNSLNKFADGVKAYGSLGAFLKDNFRFDQASEQGAGLASTNRELDGIEKRLQRIASFEQRQGVSEVVLKRYAAERAELESQVKVLRSRQQYIMQNAADPSGGATELARRGRGPKAAPSIAETPKAKAETVSEAERYIEALQKQIEKTLELTTYEQALADIQNGRIKGITPQLEAQILATAKLADENKRALDARAAQVEVETRAGKAAADRIAEIEKGNEALNREIELIGLDAFGLGVVEKARVRSIRTLKEEERARRIANGATDETLQSLNAEIAALKEREDLIERRTQRTVDEENKKAALDSNSDFTRRAAENIQDTLSGQLYKVYQGDFDNILDAWGDLVLKMAAEAQAAELNKALFGSTVGGQGNGILGALINAGVRYFSGGMSTNNTGDQLPTAGGRASGGPVAAGSIYRVNENGPELLTMGGRQYLMMGPQGGQVIANKPAERAMRPSGGSSGVVNNIVVKNENGGESSATATARPNGTGGADIEVMVRRIARQTVVGDIGSGGAIDGAMRSTYGLGRQTTRRS